MDLFPPYRPHLGSGLPDPSLFKVIVNAHELRGRNVRRQNGYVPIGGLVSPLQLTSTRAFSVLAASWSSPEWFARKEMPSAASVRRRSTTARSLTSGGSRICTCTFRAHMVDREYTTVFEQHLRRVQGT